ncbi:MAG: hypothetical protein C0407_08695 [Desulfobacca sp.]|nr:hypothetical protein [Desulfobacca sp.]
MSTWAGITKRFRKGDREGRVMKKKRDRYVRWLLWSLLLLMALPSPGIMAQGTDPGGQMPFRQEELDQMLAPIALYPDDLLSQVLMAATYPLEVVQAARWVQANPNLRGDQLAVALEEKDWDPSVKSLVNVPSILQMMNERLEWIGILGDAFLAQPDQVMDTVQKLRQKARAQGNLMTTNEQKVILEPQNQAIIIEPVVPEVIYIPVYDPMIVYGPWWWPAFPPFTYHPRGVVVPTRFIGFGFGVAIGVPWGYAWGGCDWHYRRVVVNITRNNNINNRIDRNRYAGHVTIGPSGRGGWTHDPDHRRGIAYRSQAIARQFGRGAFPGVEDRPSFRGYDRPVTGGSFVQRANRPDVQPSRVTPGSSGISPEPFRQPPPLSRDPLGTPGQRVARSEPSRQPSTPVPQPRVTPSPRPARPEMPGRPAGPGHQGVQAQQSPTAFSGFGPGGQTRQDSHRGHESLSGPKSPGPGPGGNRPAPGGGHPGGPSRQHSK